MSISVRSALAVVVSLLIVVSSVGAIVLTELGGWKTGIIVPIICPLEVIAMYHLVKPQSVEERP